MTARIYDQTTAELLLIGCGAVPDDVIEDLAAEAAARRIDQRNEGLRELAAHEAAIIPTPRPLVFADINESNARGLVAWDGQIARWRQQREASADEEGDR